MGCCTSTEATPAADNDALSQWVQRRRQQLLSNDGGIVDLLDLSGLEGRSRGGRTSAGATSSSFATRADRHSGSRMSSANAFLPLHAAGVAGPHEDPSRAPLADSDSTAPRETVRGRNPLRFADEALHSVEGDYGDLRSPAVVTDLAARVSPARRSTTTLSHSARVLRFSPHGSRASHGGGSAGSAMVSPMVSPRPAGT